jgi:hypothetical protein
MAIPTITTPKPPLNLFEAQRIQADDDWQTLYTVPQYIIPAIGAEPQQTVKAAAIMTGMVVSHNGATARKVSARIVGTDEVTTYDIVHEANVFPNDILIISLERQVMVSGEAIQVKMTSGETADIHFTYILNTRETFTEIV